MVVPSVRNAPASSALRARHRRPAQPRRKAVTVSVIGLISVFLALWHAAPYLRSIGVPVPHVQLPPQLSEAMALAVIAFLCIEVFLLVMAVANIRDQELYDRYCDLMFTWPYALMAPVVFIRTRALPNRLFNREEEEPESNSDPTVAEPEEGIPVEQYRDAIGLLINRVESLQVDRDIQDLFINDLRALLPRDVDSGRRRSEPARRTGSPMGAET